MYPDTVIELYLENAYGWDRELLSCANLNSTASGQKAGSFMEMEEMEETTSAWRQLS